MNRLEIRKIPFSAPDTSWLEIEEIINTLKSGWNTTGATAAIKLTANCGARFGRMILKAL